LKGRDRDRQQAIAAASKESYKMVIVRQRGDGDDECYDFYVNDCEPGSPGLDGRVYDAAGCDRSADLKWIRNQVYLIPTENECACFSKSFGAPRLKDNVSVFDRTQ
jgi:hypothetical protein